jgi:hypothetical protein
MKVQELRIGNLVSFDGVTLIVESIDLGGYIGLTDIILFEQLDKDDLKPINLTEEWLIKFGFKYKEAGEYKKSGYFLEIINQDQDTFIFANNKLQVSIYTLSIFIDINIEYIHQLQNLYFALTGKEL